MPIEMLRPTSTPIAAQHALLVGRRVRSVAHRARLFILFFVLFGIFFVFFLVLVVVFFLLLGDVFGVFFGVHQILQIIHVGQFDADHPAVAVGIVVDRFRIVRQHVVDLQHRCRSPAHKHRKPP